MTSSRILRAVLYGRASSDRTGQQLSVDSQLSRLRQAAKAERWRVVATKRDDGIGASAFSAGERADWPEVVVLINAGKVDVLAVWTLARATRDRQVYAALMAACAERGVRFYLNGRYVDPNDPEDAFALDIEAAVAVRTAAQISKDTKRGQASAAANGRPHGPTLWPYQRVYGSRGELLRTEVIEDRAQALRAAARAVLAGKPVDGEARRINDLGLGDRVHIGRTLRRLLVTPTIAGLRVHGGKVVGPGDWPAILDRTTHRALVELFSDPKRRTAADYSLRHLLSGIALCTLCPSTMRRIGGKRPPRLVCAEHHHVSIPQEPAEEFVTAVMIGRLSRPDALDAWQPKPVERAAAGESVASLRAQLDGWVDAAVANTITPEAFARIEAGLLAKIEKAERAARPVTVPAVLVEATTGDVAKNWEKLSPRQRRDVVKLIGAPRVLPGRMPIEERIRFPWQKD